MTCRAFIALGGAVTAATVAVTAQAPLSFRSVAEAVVVPVVVTDNNRPVAGLTSADFELVDRGVVQPINATSTESHLLDVTIVLDTSGSVSGDVLESLKRDAQGIAEALYPNDRLRLVTASQAVVDALGPQPGGVMLPLGQLNAGGGTSLYDALAAVLIAAPRSGRHQIIFALTDGADNISFIDSRDVLEVARRSSATLFVAVTPRVVGGGLGLTRSPDGSRNLRDAARATGGETYSRLRGDDAVAVFSRMLDEFRAGYTLTYTPTGVARGGWHPIDVKVKRSGYRVRARQGYDDVVR